MTLILQIIIPILFLIIIVGTILGFGVSPKKREEESTHIAEKQVPMEIRIIDTGTVISSTATTTTNPIYFDQSEEAKEIKN